MANIKIFFRDEQTDEVSLSAGITTIGRLDSNDIQIDNLSVSGNHAQILQQQGLYILQDNESTNGTAVNGKRITAAHTLQDGDIIAISKHTLKFSEEASSKPGTSQQASGQHISDAGSTMMINRAQMNNLLDEHRIEDASKKGQVISWLEWRGKKHLSGTLALGRGRIVIGKSHNADLNTGGWLFTPSISATINYQGEGYVIKPREGTKIKINQRLSQKTEKLHHGDQVEVRSINFTFFIKAVTDD